MSKRERAKVLAVQLPAPCPLSCDFCRTPNHAEGDSNAVFEKVVAELPRYEELYLTSNGETGLSPIFQKLIDVAHGLGVKVSVLCATPISVVPGLCRVEISLNQNTHNVAHDAIKKAKTLGIRFVVSVIENQKFPLDPETVAYEVGADGVLIRPLQKEGRYRYDHKGGGKEGGEARVWQRPGSELGSFPVSAYAELVGYGETPVCIDHFGHAVPLLGSPEI